MNVYIGYRNLYLLLDWCYSLILKKKRRFIAKLSGCRLLPYNQTPIRRSHQIPIPPHQGGPWCSSLARGASP